jgi:hypothetical protein
VLKKTRSRHIYIEPNVSFDREFHSMHEVRNLNGLVVALQQAVNRKELSSNFLVESVNKLVELGYEKYNLEKFPKLKNTSSFSGDIGITPMNLAEALIWKLGRWQTYRTYVENFNNKELKVSPHGGVVLSAFAKHMQNPDCPIYDQHAIRALWAIGNFTDDEQDKCASLLLDKSSNWKAPGSGDDGTCYDLFVSHLMTLCSENGVCNEEVDQLLMPLGQALKKSSKAKRGTTSVAHDFQRFRDICWPRINR